MINLIKPQRLKRGDKVATVSLSWGGAGDPDILWRYNVGKERLRELFGLDVVEMPNTLKGTEYLYRHPEKRAEDLMQAFADPTVKAVFSCIGGDESIRLLPYVDFSVISRNPKIFIGYSDTTITHLMCLKAGLSSFYGASVLGELAENVEMYDYTRHWLERALFSDEPIGVIQPSPVWTSEFLPWEEKNRPIRRKLQQNTEYELLQGTGQARGRLIGGCVEVLEMAKSTDLWPAPGLWEGAILFLETSEDKPEPDYLKYWLRNYGAQGILNKISGIIVGKPYDNLYYDEYKKIILKVIRDEFRLSGLPVLYNLSFGHTSPQIVLPIGAMAEIDCDRVSFSITESGVI